MNTTDSNTLFEGIAYNDFEIDLMLKTYGSNKSILKNKEKNKDEDKNKFLFNREV